MRLGRGARRAAVPPLHARDVLSPRWHCFQEADVFREGPRWMANVDPVVATDIRAFEGDDAIITAIPRTLELWSILGWWAGRASLRPCSLRKSVNNGRYSGPSFWAPKTLAVAARISLLRLSDEPGSSYCVRLTQGLQNHWRANGDEGCATPASRSCLLA